MPYSPAHLNQARAVVATLPRQRWLVVGIVGSVVTLAVVYLTLVNGTAAQGVAIRELKSQLNEIKLEHQRLESQAAELQSFHATEQTLAPSTFVAVERVEYLAAVAPTVGVAVR